MTRDIWGKSLGKLVWRTIGLFLACASLLVLVVLAIDLLHLRRLRIGTQFLAAGEAESRILQHLGPASSIRKGSRIDSTGNSIGGYTVWIYCTSFDWNGIRSRWNETSLIPYWFSRINPAVDDHNDAVIVLWIRNGKLDVIENATGENLFGIHPQISL